MPEPVKRGARYMPGLDGLRAIAVLAVVVYHLKFAWAPGGLLGVGVFFTLSGYLITDILLAQVARGGIKLGSFWIARARRLLPGLFLMLIVVMAWVTVIGPHQAPDFNDSAISAIFYVNNWWLIFHNVSYFAQFSTPEPLNHLWSLSVEEQFYIVWPLLLIVAVRLIPEVNPRSGVRPRLAGVTLAVGLVSAIVMTLLFTPGLDPSRVYYGTDTRAQELLVGAALAMVWPSRRLRPNIAPGARRVIDGAGLLGLGVMFLMFWQTEEFTPFLYRGGFLVLSLSTALVVASLAHPASRLAPLVGCRPMRWIGERSYGIYLWHFPIIVLTTPEGAHSADLPRAIAQVAATFAVAALSWRYVENPIRHGALGRALRSARGGRWRGQRIPRAAWAAVAFCGLVLTAAFLGLAGVGGDPDKTIRVGEIAVAKTVTAKDTGPVANRTVCNSVVHIGDSTSEGLVSSDYLPDPRQQIAAQYARVGATTAHLEVSGARSIYETFEGNPNAYDVAVAWKQQGFDGCWVLALGTNETANVAAGSNYTLNQRIDRMMSAAAGDPVLWVNVRSLETSGPYAEANMQKWNDTLLSACDRYPNMRIYDWASDVQDQWFIPDGIHFTTPGYAARSRLIADALLEAFPAGEKVDRTDSSDCVVDPGRNEAGSAGSSAGSAGSSAGSASASTTASPN
ncbi:MAG: acyltransferase family protein [Solirubrobacterales bacterium]